MNATKKLIDFAKKHGSNLKLTQKVKQKKSAVNSAAKQRELVIKIATDLGYLE